MRQLPTGRRVTDAELIRAARDNPAAFETLFERHAAPLQAWLFAQTRDWEAARDLRSETFAHAWHGARRFRGTDDRAGGAWLYGIARHLLYQHYRHGRVETKGRQRLGVKLEDLADDGGIEELRAHMETLELTPDVQDAFSSLTIDQQRAIGYRVIDELSYADVAQQLGCSTETARSHVFRGLRTLRTAITKGVRV